MNNRWILIFQLHTAGDNTRNIETPIHNEKVSVTTWINKGFQRNEISQVVIKLWNICECWSRRCHSQQVRQLGLRNLQQQYANTRPPRGTLREHTVLQHWQLRPLAGMVGHGIYINYELLAPCSMWTVISRHHSRVLTIWLASPWQSLVLG